MLKTVMGVTISMSYTLIMIEHIHYIVVENGMSFTTICELLVLLYSAQA